MVSVASCWQLGQVIVDFKIIPRCFRFELASLLGLANRIHHPPERRVLPVSRPAGLTFLIAPALVGAMLPGLRPASPSSLTKPCSRASPGARPQGQAARIILGPGRRLTRKERQPRQPDHGNGQTTSTPNARAAHLYQREWPQPDPGTNALHRRSRMALA
jgi:hypothetical protein